MWQTLFACSIVAVAALGSAVVAQQPRSPYGVFDAIAEGAERSEAQRLSLIGSQLDTVDRLRLTRAGAPRSLVQDPSVEAVYPYGRRGILGLRPRGYVVVRRAPVAAYRSPYFVEAPPYERGYDAAQQQAVRQPIGHEQLRTGPNQWEYRPLYAENGQIDETPRQIERSLRPLAPDDRAQRTGFSREDRRTRRTSRVVTPEELPELQELNLNGNRAQTETRPPTPLRGAARDIARDSVEVSTQQPSAPRSPENRRVPPTPPPDPPQKPAPNPPADENEVRGPLLQIPAPGN